MPHASDKTLGHELHYQQHHCLTVEGGFQKILLQVHPQPWIIPSPELHWKWHEMTGRKKPPFSSGNVAYQPRRSIAPKGRRWCDLHKKMCRLRVARIDKETEFCKCAFRRKLNLNIYVYIFISTTFLSPFLSSSILFYTYCIIYIYIYFTQKWWYILIHCVWNAVEQWKIYKSIITSRKSSHPLQAWDRQFQHWTLAYFDHPHGLTSLFSWILKCLLFCTGFCLNARKNVLRAEIFETSAFQQ